MADARSVGFGVGALEALPVVTLAKEHTRVLVIGGTGSLGRKLISRFLGHVEALGIYSRDEAKHWTIRNEISGGADRGLKFWVGDIRDKQRIRAVVRQFRPTTIIIAAALKQVDTCEISPEESIQTNLAGTSNVVEVVSEEPDFSRHVHSVLFVSTDKACSPINVYGMCKALSERIVTSQVARGSSGIRFLCVRYGNVLESRGSIIPLFKYQAESGDYLTVTDPSMTRFVMTLDDSVDLIATALNKAGSGETWVPRLPAMRIGDLAGLFARRYGKQIKIIGARPGEKLHEDLINEAESSRSRRFEQYYVIEPVFSTEPPRERFTYSSCGDVMSASELEGHLSALGVLDLKLPEFTGLRIEEIRTTAREDV